MELPGESSGGSMGILSDSVDVDILLLLGKKDQVRDQLLKINVTGSTSHAVPNYLFIFFNVTQLPGLPTSYWP